MSITARMLSLAARRTMSSAGGMTAAGAEIDGEATGLAGFGVAVIWVGSSAAVSASVSVGGQLGRAQLGPSTACSNPPNHFCQLTSTDVGSAA